MARGATRAREQRQYTGVQLDDGLDEQEAVDIAFAQSPAYRADMARIDAARADLDEAQRPANPQISVLGAFGPISAFATVLAPLESLWQTPKRSAAAARSLESIAESLVQTGLDLARDARLAHIERGLAEDRLRIRSELAAVFTQIDGLATQRLELGEVSAQESNSLRAEAALAADARQIAETDLSVARARLYTVLGLDAEPARFAVVFTRTLAPPPDLPALIVLARKARPDVRAAELSLHAALARAGWERSRVIAVAAQLEGHWTRPDVLAARAGARIELPLFGANPGGRGRAQAEILRSEAALAALRQRVVLEVVQAHASAMQAQASLARFRAEVLPTLMEAQGLATTSYELGEESFVVVLDVLRRLAESRLREAELVGQARRAEAELERAIGARIGGVR